MSTRPFVPSSQSEWFDVMNEDGTYTGKQKLRGEVHRDGDWHRSEHIWVISATDGRILLQQRAKCKDSFPGFWDVSCAGHVTADEIPVRAALAELEEELGIIIPLDKSVELIEVLSGITLPKSIISNPSSLLPTALPDSSSPTFLSTTHIVSILDKIQNTADILHSSPSLFYLCTIPRVVISQQGKFIDREITDVFVCVSALKEHEFRLQADEVDKVKYVCLEEYLMKLQNKHPSYVPFPDLEAYINWVFNPLQTIIDLITNKTANK
jgi:isopentenyldiphosphate isomerase